MTTPNEGTARRRRYGDRIHWWSMARVALLALVLLAGCGDGSIGPFDPDVPDDPATPDGLIGGAEGSAASGMFVSLSKSAAQGAAGEIGGQAAGWAMGALGLSSGSPDYSAQLDKIDDDLQVIIGQLNDIEKELNAIEGELTVLNCSTWATALTGEKGRVDYLIGAYQSLVSTAANGGLVPSAEIADWVDQVLGLGSYASQQPIGQVISTFASTLTGPASTGVIPACAQSVPVPGSVMAGDGTYYGQVNLFTDYYYNYQVRALFLYIEAQHYRAWVAAGSPGSDVIPADSVQDVCADPNGALYCNQAAGRANDVYNALLAQYTAAGAPYTGDNFVLKYDADNPYLFPLSLEDFTKAAGSTCTYPLVSSAPCGVMAVRYDDTAAVNTVHYLGYTNWGISRMSHLDAWVEGWKSGTPGQYLEKTYGFKNMENKIIVSSTNYSYKLKGTDAWQVMTGFFDTDMVYGWQTSPINTQSEFEKLMTQTVDHGANCTPFNVWLHVREVGSDSAPKNRNKFYDLAGSGEKCEGTWYKPFVFSETPGWMLAFQDGRNHNTMVYGNSANLVQFRWPFRHVATLTCTGSRSTHNPAGVWSMCGDDFVAWVDRIVPRPVTCDLPAAGVSCTLDATTIENAHNKYG